MAILRYERFPCPVKALPGPAYTGNDVTLASLTLEVAPLGPNLT